MIPTWLHPILRKILMGMVNDEWTKAGRPILAENVRVVEGMVFDSGVGRSSVGINEEIPMRTRAQVLFIEEDPMKRCDNPSCETCGGTKRVQPVPCVKCGSTRVRPSDLVGMWICVGCGAYEGDLDHEDTIPCPTCKPDAKGERVECEHHEGEPVPRGYTCGEECPDSADFDCTVPAHPDAPGDEGGGGADAADIRLACECVHELLDINLREGNVQEWLEGALGTAESAEFWGAHDQVQAFMRWVEKMCHYTDGGSEVERLGVTGIRAIGALVKEHRDLETALAAERKRARELIEAARAVDDSNCSVDEHYRRMMRLKRVLAEMDRGDTEVK